MEYLSLKDHVYNYIVEQINNGSLLAGKKVNENHISESLNVSRTPVREALIQLTSDGLLENIPRKGFVIKSLTKEEAKETYFIIGALDGLAASLALPFLTEKDMKEMEFYIQSIDLAINTENYRMYDKMQEAFHGVYHKLCPNKSLIELLLQLEKKFMKNLGENDSTDRVKEMLTQLNNEHREILDFFKNGDAIALERFLKEVHWNMERAEKVLL